MKKSGILHPALCELLAATGHTDWITICDSGFPVPIGPQRIDLALVSGIPTVLDVLRAIRREGSLPALEGHLEGLLAQSTLDAGLREELQQCLERVCTLAEAAAGKDADTLARRAGTALYNITTAIAMAWEASRMHSPERMEIARLVLRHRLQPSDPLSDDRSGEAALAESQLLGC